MTTIELTEEQAALFVLFMRNYDAVGLLIASGVFDLREGSATLHFSKTGKLLKVSKETHHYADSYPQVVPGQLDSTIVLKL